MVNKKKLLIIGAGYVGSASALSLLMRWHEVYLWDKEKNILDDWTQLKIPYKDADLCRAVEILRKRKTRPIILEPAKIEILGFDAVILCVGTPANSRHGYNFSDLRAALETTSTFIRCSKKKSIPIFIRSTLAPNCMRDEVYPLMKKLWKNQREQPTPLYFPEFLREGSALDDLKSPPLNVIGTAEGKVDVRWLANCFGLPRDKIIVTSTGVAELIKISCNVFHALKICFSNEIGTSASLLGIDATEVMRIFSQDTKLNLSDKYLKPGFPYGGPCLNKELQGLLHHEGLNDFEFPLLKNVERSNQNHLSNIVGKISALKRKYKCLGILGLSFKSGSTDTRNSPVHLLVNRLKGDFKFVSFHELHKHVTSVEDFKKFLNQSHLILLGSAKLSPSQRRLLKKSKKPVMDLRLDFSNKDALESYPKYSSIF